MFFLRTFIIVCHCVIVSLCHCVSLVSKHLVFRSYRGDFNHEELCVGGHEQSMWNVQISGWEDDLTFSDIYRLFLFLG